MASPSSNKVYAVLGLLCVDKTFRREFFQNPIPTAQARVGSLNPDETYQINGLARTDLNDLDKRRDFVANATEAFDGVYQMYNCPFFPCPGI